MRAHPGKREVLRDGAWAGRRCFVIGGGPSLRGFDWSLLSGELTIGINRAYEFVEPSVIFTIDRRFYRWIKEHQYGDSAQEKLDAAVSVKVGVKTGQLDFPEWWHELTRLSHDGVSTSLVEGLHTGENSGYAAINLAVCLGCREIYLLGFDMHGDGNGSQAWFHSGHPQVQKEHVYDKFLAHFYKLAPMLKERGVCVVNCNMDSALTCFPKQEIYHLPPTPSRPIVISYYTRGTGYEDEARHMAQSACFYGLERDIVSVDTRGGWQANTYYKAQFIREALDRHPHRDVLWLDADTQVLQYPAMFDDLDADMAFNVVDWSDYTTQSRNDRELNTSVLYCANNERVRALLDAWIVLNAERGPESGVWEQKNLQDVIERGGHGLMIEHLPDTYCQIYDLMRDAGDPVIELHQASRRLKQEVGA